MDMVRNVNVTVRGDVRRLQLNQGDRVVACFRERLPLTAIRDVKLALETHFPRNEVLVICGIESLAILPPDVDVPTRIAE